MCQVLFDCFCRDDVGPCTDGADRAADGASWTGGVDAKVIVAGDTFDGVDGPD